jgi:hypothetical protein
MQPQGNYTQPGLGIGDGTAQVMDPLDFVQRGAQAYAASKGLSYNPKGLDTLQDNPRQGYTNAMALHKAQGQDRTPANHTIRSFEALRTGINDQFDHMTKPESEGGMGIRMEATTGDPYGSPQEMRDDLANNKRIKVLPTSETGSHHFFTDEENDKFRAVHDVFGHAGIGRSFSRHGEEAALRAHQQMFPPEAHEALANDLRAQNNYLVYNNQGNRFPPQNKMRTLPAYIQGDTGGPPESQPPSRKPNKQGKLL